MTIILDNLFSAGHVILDNLQNGADPLPSITSIGTCRDGASCVLTVTNASNSGNAVYLNGATQEITAESSTEITFTVDGNFSYRDASVEIVIEDEDGFQSAAKLATLLPETGYRTVIISVTPPADTTSRISSTPDIAIGDQIIYGDVTGTGDEFDVDVFVNGVCRWLPAPVVEAMKARIFDGAETSAAITQTFEPLPIDLVTVPDVVGDTQAVATATLEGLTLVVVPVTAYSASVAVGLVIATQPAAGLEVPEQSAVEVTVSLGVAPPTMPNLVGQSVSNARAQLISLELNPVVQYVRNDAEFGEVLQQGVVPGTVIVAGTDVSLLVSAGPTDNSKPPGVIRLRR
jgi:hypothetical protein